ncbi:SDR family NAD(P)-dependent oxidoreductase [Pseudonocardia sp. WMMC193]|uniref:SDR family NAD(P)-dependent oxidoreductase n=1 Tax=Pseudonocardia sp. WMMC193 TaxID=2911965 RepID=UPI001F491FC7|nr:SDR family oxidoreductase [Pseudonocardia sp. WMMC193]MCF7552288.1 SDR family oxidoreductase [Pseudonocardia sp. WMMC193]
MTDLSGKVALITGSTRGIGRAIALRYASCGASVVINHRDDDANAAQTVKDAEAVGGRAVAVRADVSKTADLDRLFEDTRAAFGDLHIVVANAGVEIIDQPVLEVTEEQFDRLFALNTKGAFFTLQKAARQVVDGGRLLYIGSSTTCSPFAGVGLYGSSKMAPRYLVGVLALELGKRGVTVNTILPTVIEGAGVFTDIAADDRYHAMNAAMRPIGGRMGRPSDVADAAEYFASDLAGWVSGQHLLVSGGAQM